MAFLAEICSAADEVAGHSLHFEIMFIFPLRVIIPSK